MHDGDVLPSPESNGVFVSPGYETTISVKLEHIKRLAFPYKSNCTNVFPHKYRFLFEINIKLYKLKKL